VPLSGPPGPAVRTLADVPFSSSFPRLSAFPFALNNDRFQQGGTVGRALLVPTEHSFRRGTSKAVPSRRKWKTVPTSESLAPAFERAIPSQNGKMPRVRTAG